MVTINDDLNRRSYIATGYVGFLCLTAIASALPKLPLAMISSLAHQIKKYRSSTGF